MHAGAYYGLAVSFMLSFQKRSHSATHPKNGSSYLQDVFSMLGTITLFLYWPSFNGALLLLQLLLHYLGRCSMEATTPYLCRQPLCRCCGEGRTP